MRTVAEFAVESQKRALLQFIDQTDNEIITFYHRLLTKINETSAETFMTDMQTYPNIPEENRSADVKEVLEFIAAWRTWPSNEARKGCRKRDEAEEETHFQGSSCRRNHG